MRVEEAGHHVRRSAHTLLNGRRGENVGGVQPRRSRKRDLRGDRGYADVRSLALTGSVRMRLPVAA
jgi:hypothetical protein